MSKRNVGMFFSLAFGLFFSFTALALPAGAVRKAVELGAKVSRRALSPAAREAAELAARKAAAKYGDEALRLVGKGGLEVLEQGAKHGNAFWRPALKHPALLKSLVRNGDELIPLARRIGPEVLILEAKAPGLAARVASELGDDMVGRLAKASADDTPRLLGYAAKADTPATKALLLEKYAASRHPSRFLQAFDWSRIMAGGLSAGAIVAAYKISDGIGTGVKTLAEKHPEQFGKIAERVLSPFRWGLLALFALLLFPLARRIFRRAGKNR